MSEKSYTAMSQAEAFSLFDTSSSVVPEELIGLWKGAEITTGHPMDGMLSAARWYGKEIHGQEAVHPLLFTGVTGKVFIGNPGQMPLEMATGMPRPVVKAMFTAVSPFIRTSKGRARLRIQEYRGKRTTVLLYDQKPIIDIFVRLDEKRMMGVTDAKWIHDMGYFFTLEAVNTIKSAYSVCGEEYRG